jgi:RNA polymerase sigma factor (sigma-70 family)
MDKRSDDSAFNPDEVAYRALLSGIVGRDESALAALYDATVGKVLALALRITGNREEAEEVVSDVYLQVWARARDYSEARGSVKAWLYTICRSRALDRLRRRDIAETSGDFAALCAEQPSPDVDPLDALLGMERDTAMHQALSAISPVERQLLTLAFFKGLSHQEIADYTNAPLGSVKTILRHAMQKLRQRLCAPAEVRKQTL